MPTYDYECDACGHALELFQSINAPVETTCPECKKKKLRRLFGTGAAIVFKGSGFYQTDYRSENYQKSAKADKESSSSSDGAAKDASSKDASKKDVSKPEAGSKGTSRSEGRGSSESGRRDSTKSSDAKPKRKGGSSAD